VVASPGSAAIAIHAPHSPIIYSGEVDLRVSLSLLGGLARTELERLPGEHSNKDPKRFIWTAKSKPILAPIVEPKKPWPSSKHQDVNE
jgi:hypothetical protein